LLQQRQQSELDPVQQSAEAVVAEDEEPVVRHGLAGPFHLPVLAIPEELVAVQAPCERVFQHELTQQVLGGQWSEGRVLTELQQPDAARVLERVLEPDPAATDTQEMELEPTARGGSLA